MSINSALVDAINLLSERINVDQDKALGALLKVDANGASEFAMQIYENREFWRTKLPANNLPDEEEGIGYVYLDGELLNPNNSGFKIIQQAAAKQSIKLKLQGLSEEQVKELLVNDAVSCRTLLATTPFTNALVDLALVPGWNPQNEDVLTDEGIKEIRLEAQGLLLESLINNCEHSTDLTALNTAITNNIDIKQKAMQLGFPDTELLLDQTKLVTLQQIISDKLALLDVEYSFENYIETLSMANKKVILEADDFKSALDEPYKTHLRDKKLAGAKELLGISYLKAYLRSTDKNLLAAYKAASKELLLPELKALVGDHPYVEEVLTTANFDELRKSMVQGIIGQADIKLINNLERADLTEFKKILTEQLHIDVTWVQEGDLKDLKFPVNQRTLKFRTTQFEELLAKNSVLGSGAHPNLIEAFKKLSRKKQAELLNPAKQINIIRLLKAQDTMSIERYLGKGAKGVDALINENIRLAELKAIHNIEVVKVLASLRPNINLTKNQIDAINKAFVSADNVPVYKRIDFDSPGEYQALIDEIYRSCGGVSKNDFYQAFGLNDDGSDFLDPRSALISKIKEQHERSENILTEYYKDTTSLSEKKLLDVLLRVSKEAKIVSFAQIMKTLKKCENVESFIAGFQQAQTRSELTRELSATVFADIKNEIRKEELQKPRDINTIKNINDEIKKLNTELSHLKEIRTLLIKNTMQLNDPENDMALSLGINKSNPQLEKNCVRILDQLRREKQILQGYLNSLQLPENVVMKVVSDLKSDIKQELKDIDKNLNFYEKLQGVIVKARNTETEYGLNSEKVTWVDKPEGSQVVAATEPVTLNTIVTLKVDLPLLKHQAKLKKGQERHYTVHCIETKPDFDGTFKEKYNSDASFYTGKDKLAPKVPTEEFEITKFPSEMPIKPGTELKGEARAVFAMEMAKQIFLNWDGKTPIVIYGSKPEELKYLWTALKVLGENHPQFHSGVIKVKSLEFKPQNEMGLIYGYNSASLYETVFKQSPGVQEAKIEFKKMMKEKLGSEKEVTKIQNIVKEETAPSKETNSYKKKLKDVQQDIDNIIQEEGPPTSHPKYN